MSTLNSVPIALQNIPLKWWPHDWPQGWHSSVAQISRQCRVRCQQIRKTNWRKVSKSPSLNESLGQPQLSYTVSDYSTTQPGTSPATPAMRTTLSLSVSVHLGMGDWHSSSTIDPSFSEKMREHGYGQSRRSTCHSHRWLYYNVTVSLSTSFRT